MKIFFNIISCLILGALIFVIGGFFALVTSFATGKTFYSYVIMAASVGLFIYVVLRAFDVLRKNRLKVLGIFILICAITAGGYKGSEILKQRIPTVGDNVVDLNSYKPFAKDTKAVSLEEASTLKLDSNLPRLDGATALYPLYSAFAKAVYPEKDYQLYDSEVMCTTTEGSYDNLFSGRADIIFAAKPSSQQLDEAKSRGIELKLTPIGREAFVFFVNSKNKVEGLTSAEIRDIYSGNITDWKAVGGSIEKIRAFQRPENSGSQTMLQNFMAGKKLMTPPSEDVVSMMDGIIKQTSDYRNYKNAIGYSFLFYATEMVKNNQIRLLKVDGVYPSKETIKSKEYPLSAEFYAVTTGSRNPNVEPFIKWILDKQGQYLVDKTGYTALSAGK